MEDELEHQRSYNTQSSLTSSRATRNSFSSVSTTSGILDRTSSNELNISDYSNESDDEGYETVAAPSRAHFSDHISPSLPVTPSHEPSIAETCTDMITNDSQSRLTSPIITHLINPFQQFALQTRSLSVDMTSTDISPVDPHAFFAYECNRLDSFKKLNRETFAQVKVEELAYAGFYLNAEGTAVQCPWCMIGLTEQRFEKILHRRPIIPGSPLNDEPWTAMRVHRHENGQFTDKAHSCCPWVRRELGGLYPNVSMV